MSDRELLMTFIASLTLCDNMGEVVDDIAEVLKRLGEDIEWSDFDELRRQLGARGVKTLYGTALIDGSLSPFAATPRPPPDVR